MTGHAAGHGQGRDGYGAHAPGYYAPAPEFGTPTAAMPASTAAARAGNKGFIGSLFDLGFTSFVTPKVIKVLYLLIMIGTILTALIYSFLAFKVNAGFGLAMLFLVGPLFTLIVMAIWRISLEFFMVIFRISDDIRALRERGDLR